MINKTNKKLFLNFLAALLLLVSSIASAQKRTVKGYVLDSVTHSPLTNAIITNENTHKVAFTNNLGFFSITTSKNDMLFFDALNYKFDTLYVNNILPDTITIFMAPEVFTLPGVTVTTEGYSQYQLDSLRRRISFIDDAGRKAPAISRSNSLGAGIAINMDALLNKKNKQRKKAYKYFERSERDAYIDYRYSPALVMEYTGLKGEALSSFMQKTTPSYEWLRTHTTDEDVVYYINDKLKQYKKK
jgi:hypothetical protein